MTERARGGGEPTAGARGALVTELDDIDPVIGGPQRNLEREA